MSKLMQEHTLARWIFQQIQDDPFFTDAKISYIFDTLVGSLKGSKERNDPQKLIPLLNKLLAHSKKQVAQNKAAMKTCKSLKRIISELNELRDNLAKHQISITSAFEGYTLNRTTRLINVLSKLIEELEMEIINFKESFFKNEEEETKKLVQLMTTQSEFAQKPFNLSTVESRKIFAEKFKTAIVEIRKLIGSPEMMPKGLIITFAKEISQALCDLAKRTDAHECFCQDLKELLRTELESISNNFPDLAEAGINLQKAIESSKQAGYKP